MLVYVVFLPRAQFCIVSYNIGRSKGKVGQFFRRAFACHGLESCWRFGLFACVANAVSIVCVVASTWWFAMLLYYVFRADLVLPTSGSSRSHPLPTKAFVIYGVFCLRRSKAWCFTVFGALPSLGILSWPCEKTSRFTWFWGPGGARNGKK